MLARTGALLQRMKERARAQVERTEPDMAEVDDAGLDGDDAPDPKVYRLEMRKRRQARLLSQMLQQGGYGELAKVAGFRREPMEDDSYEP